LDTSIIPPSSLSGEEAPAFPSTRLPLSQAQELAAGFAAAFAPGCLQIVVAGSVRRRKPFVKDVELVAVRSPEAEGGLFSAPSLDDLIDEAVAGGLLLWDEVVKRRGERYKRLTICEVGVPLEVFIARPVNFGNILAIRTGDAQFSHALVTRRSQGGLMPETLRQWDARLWERDPAMDGPTRAIDCPNEAAFFGALGLPVLDPALRDAEGAQQLRALLHGRPIRLGGSAG
jgi:DNA polymerase/3'-5' exonuclease PolX